MADEDLEEVAGGGGGGGGGEGGGGGGWKEIKRNQHNSLFSLFVQPNSFSVSFCVETGKEKKKNRKYG